MRKQRWKADAGRRAAKKAGAAKAIDLFLLAHEGNKQVRRKRVPCDWSRPPDLFSYKPVYTMRARPTAGPRNRF